MNFENKLPTTTTLDTSDGVSEVSKDAKNPFDTPPISPIGESPSSLDFKNDLPSTTAASHESNTATEVYQNSDVFISGKPPKQRSCCKPTRKYTTRRIYLTDLVMHLLSVAFAIPTLILYSLDLAYSNNYFAKLHPHESRGHMPAAISVLSPFGITGANMSLIWSLQYLYFDRRLAKERELDRKWRTLYDAFLWVWTLAVSDATFSVRTNSSNCTSLGLEDWGACNGARPGIMIAAGICSVMLSVTIHIRWSVTLDIWSKRRKERKRIENERLRALGIDVPEPKKRSCCNWSWFRRSQDVHQHETNGSQAPSSPSYEVQHVSRQWSFK